MKEKTIKNIIEIKKFEKPNIKQSFS